MGIFDGFESARYFWRQKEIGCHQLYADLKQRKSHYFCRGQSYKLGYNSLQRIICKRNSGAAQIAPFNQPLLE